jgi:hypothetical protein
MTVASWRYGYQQAPWDAPLSFGLQALIEYNGYVINDRRQSDRIIVRSIGGLDDPDSSDTREAVPGDEGEFVYESLYRGRTIMLSGRIEAGSLGTLKRLERDLKAAYAPLSESPLQFRWFDVYDGFDDAQTLQNYTLYGASSLLVVRGGLLAVSTNSGAPSNSVIMLRSAEARLWGDCQVTTKFFASPPNVNYPVSAFVIPSFVDQNNYVKVTYLNAIETDSGQYAQLSIDMPYGTVASQLLPITRSGTAIWLRGKREGDLITAEAWMQEPDDDRIPDYAITTWLAGQDADIYGDQKLTLVGMGVTPFQAGLSIDNLEIRSLCPCDIAFDAKKMPGGMSIKDGQSSQTRFIREFQITMRASRPYARCATQSRSLALIPSSGNTTQRGFSSPLSSPLEASQFISGSITFENDILFVENRGVAPNRPKIVIYGAIGQLLIANLTNGDQISWSGNVLDGDRLVFDCAARKVVDASGANMAMYLSVARSRWLQLEPGWNDIYLTGSGYSGNTKMVVFYHGSWV